MAHKKLPLIATAALIITALAITLTTAAVINSSRTVPAGGDIATPTPTPTHTPTPTPSGGGGGGGGGVITNTVDINIYSDSACTQTADFVSWGTLNPGEQITRTVWVKNTGNTAAILSMNTANWTPSGAEQWITVTWDREGQTIASNQVIQATLTLSVSSSITGVTNFNFDVLITGTA